MFPFDDVIMSIFFKFKPRYLAILCSNNSRTLREDVPDCNPSYAFLRQDVNKFHAGEKNIGIYTFAKERTPTVRQFKDVNMDIIMIRRFTSLKMNLRLNLN